MNIDNWIANRMDNRFIIEDEDGNVIYDGRKTDKEPPRYVMNSMITDMYTWHDVIVLAI